MKNAVWFFVLACLLGLLGPEAESAAKDGSSPVVAIAYTTNTWGNINPVHS
jgi:hypothetical protein